MRKYFGKSLIVALSLLMAYLTAGAGSLAQKEWMGRVIASDEQPVQVAIPVSNSFETRLNFDFAGAELNFYDGRQGCEIEIPGEGHTLTEGVPSLPAVSRMIAVPAQARVLLDYRFSGVEVRENVDVLPTTETQISEIASDIRLKYENYIYSSDEVYPPQLTSVSEPVIMGGLRLVRVTVNPIRYNPVQRRLYFYRNVEVSLRYEEGGTVNTLPAEPRRVSRSFAAIYRAHIANFDLLDFEVDEEWGTLLIVTPDNTTVLQYVNELADWKRRKGINTVVATLSQTGSSYYQIKSFVQNAYNTWNPKLAYLILIGDTGGSVAVPASNSTGDHEYGLLAGNDYLADISVGRFSCANTSQLQVEVSKVIEYESAPRSGTQPQWFSRGAVCAGEAISGISTIMTNRAIRFKALEVGYTQVDTLWYTMGGSVATFTNNEINSGVGFYNYRGYYGMSGYSTSHINQLTNYHMLPFVVTITCGTGDIVGTGSDYPEEFFRVGTTANPKGAIAAIGTATTGTNTRCNNCVDNGIFGALFDYGIYQFGDALVSAKFELFLSYPDNSSYVTSYSNWNNLIGDPSCQMWTDAPEMMTIVKPDTIPVGASYIEMNVITYPTRIPLEGVDVCLSGTGMYETGLTDENGDIFFPLSRLSAGTFDVTCCRHNYIPILSRVVVTSPAVYVGVDSVVVDDDNNGQSRGNGDGLINPGETIELGVKLKNYGNQSAATGITTILRCVNGTAVILDSTQSFANLNPLSSSPITFGYVFAVESDVAHGELVELHLRVNANQGNWNSYIPLATSAPDLAFRNYQVFDPNNRLDPGDSSPMLIYVTNIGGLTGVNLEAVLVSDNPNVTVDPIPSNYGAIAPQQNAVGDSFIVTVSPTVPPGMPAQFHLFFTGNNGFIDTVDFDLVIGETQQSDPTGPDNYGYWAIDSEDTSYANRPVYNWMEINPSLGGSGTLIPLSDYGNEQDDTELVNLPFSFFYYGERYNQVSVCSNGWLAFGNQVYFTHFRNWPIPSTLGPYAMVAPFWDDLYLVSNPDGRVYYYYEQAANRFIVEWSRVRNRGSGTPTETFQVILYDPSRHPTPTGDGEIVFQYNTISNVRGVSTDNDYATVGIKSPDNTDGIQYSYWNHYAAGACPLRAELAVKFTTRTPLNARPPVIIHSPHPNVTQRDTAYFIEARVSSWTGLNYNEMKVYYAQQQTGPFTEIPLMPLTSGVEKDFIAVIPEQPAGTAVHYHLRVQDINRFETRLPANAPNSTLNFLVGPQIQIVFDDAELERGWSLGVPGDSATSGIWIREDPVISIADNNTVVQPEDDHTPAPGTICFVTGNADSGAVAGTNDVDNGQTTLVTPAYDLSHVAHPLISYWYWYTNDQGNNPAQDYWVVDVSNNNGSAWHNVVNTSASTPQVWDRNQFMLEDYCPPSSTVRVRFIASDVSPGSLVEACVDDFSIVGIDTTWGALADGDLYISPADITISNQGERLLLSWTPVEGARTYKIYNNPVPRFDWRDASPIKETSGCSCYIDAASKESYFIIKAVR